MDPVRRVAIAAFNGGHGRVARELLGPDGDRAGTTSSGDPEGLELAHRLAGDDGDVARPEGSPPVVSVGGDVPTVDGLGTDELLAGVRPIGRRRGDLDPDDLDRIGDRLAAAAHPARDRLRLLLEDYLLRPEARSIAADRLRSFAGRERHRRRDIDGLFDG